MLTTMLQYIHLRPDDKKVTAAVSIKLLEQGADPTRQAEGYENITPSHLAAARGNILNVEYPWPPCLRYNTFGKFKSVGFKVVCMCSC